MDESALSNAQHVALEKPPVQIVAEFGGSNRQSMLADNQAVASVRRAPCRLAAIRSYRLRRRQSASVPAQ